MNSFVMPHLLDSEVEDDLRKLKEASVEEKFLAPTVSVLLEASPSNAIKSEVSEEEESAVDVRHIFLKEKTQIGKFRVKGQPAFQVSVSAN